MQVLNQIVAFSLQTDGSGRPVLTKGKRPSKQLSWMKTVIFPWDGIKKRIDDIFRFQ